MGSEHNLKKESVLLLDFPERDYIFENEVLWEVKYWDGEYNISVQLAEVEEGSSEKLESPKSSADSRRVKKFLGGKRFRFYQNKENKEEPEEVEEHASSEKVVIEEEKIEEAREPQEGEEIPTLLDGISPSEVGETILDPSFFLKIDALDKKERELEESYQELKTKKEIQISGEKKVEQRVESSEVQLSTLIREFSLESFPEEETLFPDSNPLGRDSERDFMDQEHQKILEEQQKVYQEDQNAVSTYNLKDFPLAEPELIGKLAEVHLAYFNLLTKLQDTHTLEDFKTAFQIQDRIAYLLDNQTLLYRGLTKKLIHYLERINKKLRKYYAEITLKQEDIKKINAQISRFNEYERKTQRKMERVAKETNLLKKDAEAYESSLNLSPVESEGVTEEVKREEVVDENAPTLGEISHFVSGATGVYQKPEELIEAELLSSNISKTQKQDASGGIVNNTVDKKLVESH